MYGLRPGRWCSCELNRFAFCAWHAAGRKQRQAILGEPFGIIHHVVDPGEARKLLHKFSNLIDLPQIAWVVIVAAYREDISLGREPKTLLPLSCGCFGGSPSQVAALANAVTYQVRLGQWHLTRAHAQQGDTNSLQDQQEFHRWLLCCGFPRL